MDSQRKELNTHLLTINGRVTERFLPIFLSGYISLTFFRYRQNQGFARLNGEKLIIELFMWVFVSHFSFLLAKYLLIERGIIDTKLLSELEKQILKFIFYALSGVLFSGILSYKDIYDRIKRESLKFKQSELPVYSNRMEEEFVQAIYFEPAPYVFEVSTGKFYVGVLTDADIDDSTLFEEKIFKFVPIMSGHRCNEKKP